MAKAFPKLGEESEMPMDDMPAEMPGDSAGLPGSSKEAAAKALFSAFKEQDFKAAAAALESFMDALDDASMDEGMEAEAEMPEGSPF